MNDTESLSAIATRPPARPIALRESIYLDLVRSLAAFVVVLDHAPHLYDLPFIPRWGHQAVMVFFVLSGYVICNVSDTRETSARPFLIARLARLWSVLVPAVVLTMACDAIGRSFGHFPAAYAMVPIDLPTLRISAILLFLSESWVSIQPLSNGVVWSLCAEFWYYLLFAAWTFTPPGRLRTIAVALVALLAGHKALLLLPVWLFGLVLQRSSAIRRLGLAANAALWIGALIVIVWVLIEHAYNPPIHLMESIVSPWLLTQLAQARVFWFDWLFGLVVAAHLLGARTIMNRLPIERIERGVRWCAGISFAAYLFHMPILTMTAAFLPPDQGLLGIGLTLCAIAVLGPAAERSKRWWRRTIAGGVAMLDMRMKAAHPV